MALKTLIIDAQKCIGCRSCESYCALKHENVCNPAKGRIHVVKWEQEAIFVPINCMRCEVPACELACPKHATYRNYRTGALEVDANRCIGCISCVFECPFGATFVDPVDGRVLLNVISVTAIRPASKSVRRMPLHLKRYPRKPISS